MRRHAGRFGKLGSSTMPLKPSGCCAISPVAFANAKPPSPVIDAASEALHCKPAEPKARHIGNFLTAHTTTAFAAARFEIVTTNHFLRATVTNTNPSGVPTISSPPYHYE